MSFTSKIRNEILESTKEFKDNETNLLSQMKRNTLGLIMKRREGKNKLLNILKSTLQEKNLSNIDFTQNDHVNVSFNSLGICGVNGVYKLDVEKVQLTNEGVKIISADKDEEYLEDAVYLEDLNSLIEKIETKLNL